SMFKVMFDQQTILIIGQTAIFLIFEYIENRSDDNLWPFNGRTCDLSVFTNFRQMSQWIDKVTIRTFDTIGRYRMAPSVIFAISNDASTLKTAQATLDGAGCPLTAFQVRELKALGRTCGKQEQ
ncbi:MAG: hypothetical protein EBT56_13205, partial [Betaproteobacteria bacterium]|nr:hypothetical protein [Betaproteobacteria bacterium]